MSQDPSHRHAQDAPKHPGLASPAPLQLRGAGRSESPQPRSPRRAGKWAIPAGDRVIAGSPPSAAQRSPSRHDTPGQIPPHLPLVRGSRVLPAPSRSIRRAGPRAGSRGPPGRPSLPWPRRSGLSWAPGEPAPLPAPRPVSAHWLAPPRPAHPALPWPPPGGAAAGPGSVPVPSVPAVRGASDLSRRRPQRLGPAATGGHTPAKRTPQGFPSLSE